MSIIRQCLKGTVLPRKDGSRIRVKNIVNKIDFAING